MRNKPHKNTGSREHRLIAQNPGAMGPEAQSEKPIDAPAGSPLQAARNFLDHLAREVVRKNITDRKDQVTYCKKYLSEATQEGLNNLQAILRDPTAVPESFRQMFAFDTPEYQEIIDATHQRLQTLRSTIQDTTKTAGGHIEKYSLNVADFALGEERGKTWSKEKKVALGLGLTLGGAAIVGLTAWFIARGKDATSKARRAALTGAGILGTIAVFFGLKKIDSIYQSVQKGEKLLQKSEEALAAARQQAAETSGKMKEEWEQKIAEIERVKQKLQEGKEPSAEERELVEEVTEMESSPEDTSGTEVEEKIPSIAKETAREVVNEGSSLALAYSLVSFRELPEWTVEKDTKVQHVHDFLQGHAQIPISTLLGALMPDGSLDQNQLRLPEREKESRMKAAKLVIEYCRDRLDEVKKQGKTDEEISSMPLETYVQVSAPGFALAGGLLNAIHEHKGDFVGAMQSIDLIALTRSDQGLHEELRTFVHERVGESGADIDVRRIMENLPEMTVTVSEYLLLDEKDTDPVLRELCMHMQEETHLYVLPFFRSLFPTRSWDTNMQVNIEHAKDILYSKIPFHMAVRFYLYSRMIKRGNPAGFLPMQAEVLAYFAKNDESMLSNRKYQLANRIAQVVAGGGWEEWEQVNLSIDEELIRQAMRNIGVVGKGIATAAEQGLFRTAKESIGAYIGTGKEYPIVIGGVSTLFGGGWLMQRLYRFERNAAPDLVDQRLERATNNRITRQNLVRAARSLEFSAQEWHTAHQTFHEMRELIRQMTTAGNVPNQGALVKIGWEFQEGLHHCTTASMENSASAWSKFVNAMEKYRGLDPTVDQFLHQARAVRDTPTLRNIISIASRPVIGRVRRYANILAAPLRGVESLILRGSVAPKVDDLLRRISIAHAAGDVDDLRTLLRHDLFRDQTVRTLASRGNENANLLLSFKNYEPEELLSRNLSLPNAAPRVVAESAESAVDIAKILEDIETARSAGDHAKVGKLLTEHDVLLRKAAENGDKAAEQVLEASHFAKSSRLAKVGAGALIGIGLAYDAYLILENERELAAARKENPALAATLEARRKSLIAAGGGGALLEAGMYAAGVSGGAAFALALPVAGGAIYSEAVYDSVREWDKKSQDYLKEDAATLLSKINKEMTKRDLGTAAAHGDTIVEALWKKMPWYGEDRAAKHYQEKFEETDKGINLSQRQKLYQAYAMKNSRGENVKDSVLFQSNYLSLVSDETFVALPPEQLARAEVYANLTLMRASKEHSGEPQIISYLSSDGTQKTFDLSLFQFDGVPAGAEEKERLHAAIGEYRRIVEPALLFTRCTLLTDYVHLNEHLSEEERGKSRENLRAKVRLELVSRVRHHANKAEEYVRASHLRPYEQDVVRAELRTDLEGRMASIIDSFEEGTMTMNQLSDALQKLEYVSDEAKNSSQDIFKRSTSPIKRALARKTNPDRRELADPVKTARKVEARRLKVQDISDALINLAA